jgi:hypothetical protein
MEIVKITRNGQGISYQDYSQVDQNLFTQNLISGSFNVFSRQSVVEAVVLDENLEFINIEYDVKSYKPVEGQNNNNNTYRQIYLDPKKDLENFGYDRGLLYVQYNFHKILFNSNYLRKFWIKDISPSRTELRLSTQVISPILLQSEFINFNSNIVNNSSGFYDFYLNFGLNRLIIANNAALEQTDEGAYNLLIKLYEPLPDEFQVKNTLWIVEKISESALFQVNISTEESDTKPKFLLRGPNFDIDIADKVGQTTPYYNYNSLFSSEITSSAQKLSSYFDDKAISINVDYTDFSNFIHFSSATERLNNFVYKLGLIESYNTEISASLSYASLGLSSQISINQAVNQAKENINRIIEKFDTYEYYLYFNSESFAWPKINNTQPYELYSITSSQAISWLGSDETVPQTGLSASMYYSASYYDSSNKDIITSIIPQYIYEDPINSPMVAFMYMLAQHFDNIWLYYKDVSNRYINTNNPHTGISIDLVADALKSIGINLYTNTSVSDNLYFSLFGINQDGSLLPPTGSELIEINSVGNRGYVTSSLTTLSSNQIEKEFYKRLYHNSAYLFKTKGTQRAIKALIACYGIPEEILDVNEFGAYETYDVIGLDGINNDKIRTFYSKNELSQSVLSPFATIQKPSTLYRNNSVDVEVTFSPSNVINANISSSEGFQYIDNLIGNPEHQSLPYYPDLEDYRKTYFETYEYPHRIYEYIRLVKYFNNSLFKIIRDFVPARANLQTGITIKSHVLERNKIARKEPTVILSGSFGRIGVGNISSSGANSSFYSTDYTEDIMTPSGSVTYISNQSQEKLTGQFGGSTIAMTVSGGYMDQREISNDYSRSVEYQDPQYINYGATHNNVTESVRSKRFFDLDFSTDSVVPVNFAIITGSIARVVSASRSPLNQPIYCDKTVPYAQLQDSNYELYSFANIRYNGSSMTSPRYNTLSASVIDKSVNIFAYLVDISTASVYLPNRSDAQIKYLVDSNQNVIDLTKANNHVFDVQNIFKSQENADVALFNYDQENVYANRLVNNPTIKIYEGGYKYLPALHNLSSSVTQFGFNLKTPISFFIPDNGNSFDPNDIQWKLSSYTVAYDEGPTYTGYDIVSRTPSEDGQYIQAVMGITASYIPNTTFPPSVGAGFSASITINIPRLDGQFTEKVPITFTPGANYLVSTSFAYLYDNNGQPDPVQFSLINRSAFVSDLKVYNSSEANTNYKDFFVDKVYTSQSAMYYMTASNCLVLKLTDKYGTQDIYENYGLIYSSSSDLDFVNSSLNSVVSAMKIEAGDKIVLRDSASISTPWNEKYEFSVKSVDFTGSYNETDSRLLLYLDRTVPVNLFMGPAANLSQVDKTTNANYSSSYFIIFKRVPDETNIVLNFNPEDPNVVEEGLLYPQYISKALKDDSGNIIKALRAQNLLGSTNP